MTMVSHLIDPELRDAAGQIDMMMEQFSPMTDEKLSLWRSLNSAAHISFANEPSVVERDIPIVDVGGEAKVYVINAKPGQCRPGILHIHGGGFISGSARASVPHLQKLATALDCTVLTTEYRLAPEARFEDLVADNYGALYWMHENAEQLGIDGDRIAVVGDSAGGGLAVLLCKEAYRRNGPRPFFQCLSYPMLDDRTGSSTPVPEHLGTIGWNVVSNRFGWRCFLGCEPGSNKVPAGAVPARLEEFEGLPPTYIAVGALDLFVEENFEFARRLLVAGIPTELAVFPGAFHAFDTVVEGAAVSRRFKVAQLNALTRALAE